MSVMFLNACYSVNFVLLFSTFLEWILYILKFFSFFPVPPDRPIIYEASRREKAKNVEAYNEGSDVLLFCEVTGGKFHLTLLLIKINILKTFMVIVRDFSFMKIGQNTHVLKHFIIKFVKFLNIELIIRFVSS